MQELEIVREKIQNKYRVVKTDEDLGWNRAIDLCTNIINAHLSRENTSEIERLSRDNDGWISVEDRLPEEKGMYLVTYHPCYWDDVNPEVEVGIDTFRGKTTWAKKKFQRVIAWQPLPDPYGPERSDNHDE